MKQESSWIAKLADKLVWPVIGGLIVTFLAAFLSPRIPALNPVALTPTLDNEGSFEIATLVENQVTPTQIPTLAPPPTVEKPTQVYSVSVRCPGRDIFPLVPPTGKANYTPALHWLERVAGNAIKFGFYDENGYVRDEETLPLSRLAPGRWMSVHEFGQSEYGYVLCVEDLQTVYWATDYLSNFPEVN